MQEILLIGMILIILIRVILKHNKDFSYIKIKIKFIGLDIEIKGKEKKHPPTK